jgi:hypothetical protein
LLAEFLYLVIGYINRKVFGISAKQKLPTMI